MIVNIHRIRLRSKEIFEFWEIPENWIPENCPSDVYLPKLNWLLQLTECLGMWNEKKEEANVEELCLAYAILGELLEGWLRLFYSVYYVHCKSSGNNKYDHICKPEHMDIEKLECFGQGKIWQKSDKNDFFVSRVKSKRLYINIENQDRIGSLDNFFDDLDIFERFIEEVDIRLPYPDEK